MSDGFAIGRMGANSSSPAVREPGNVPGGVSDPSVTNCRETIGVIARYALSLIS